MDRYIGRQTRQVDGAWVVPYQLLEQPWDSAHETQKRSNSACRLLDSSKGVVACDLCDARFEAGSHTETTLNFHKRVVHGINPTADPYKGRTRPDHASK